MKPLDPTSMVIRLECRMVQDLARRSAYLACFLSAAASIPGSKGMDGKLYQDHRLVTPDDNVWPAVCRGHILGEAVVLSRQLGCHLVAGLEVASDELEQ